MVLTDKWFTEHGFNTTKEPFTSPSGAKKVFKNYIRDASGRYDGYLVEHKVLTKIYKVDDLINLNPQSAPESDVRLNNLLSALRELQADMTDVEREALWDDLREGYCTYCGSKVLPCHCWNDE